MSVSDPLLKLIKTHIYNLTINQPVTDKHDSLKPFCELLEIIFRKGLKPNTSLFDFSPKDYWNWVENLRNGISDGTFRLHPLFDVVVDQVKSSRKVTSAQGHGRYFMRLALQHKLLHNTVEALVRNPNFLCLWYDSLKSFLVNDILSEILLSLLLQISELNFQLCLENHSYLDETWIMPSYRQLQLVPCSDLGMRLHHINGRVVVVSMNERGVAADMKEIAVGDVLDEIYGKSLRNIVKGTIPNLMKRYKDVPVSLSIIKYRDDDDGSTFPPLVHLHKCLKKEGCFLEERTVEKPKSSSKKPPHALLPEDEEEEVPVHDDNEKVEYQLQYIGRTVVGQDGGVHQVEPAIRKILNEKDQEILDVTFALGETDVFVRKVNSDEVLFKVSYTEISACGRRTDCMQYFAYLAGETTCTLAKEFVAYAYKAQSEDEAKVIICSIAQGFDRTHWFV